MGDYEVGQTYTFRRGGRVRQYRYLGGDPSEDSSWQELQGEAADAARVQGPTNTRRGAPMRARAAVAAARTPEDKLATLRKFFPDAQPIEGGGKFVYTDPETGEATLFDEQTGGVIPGFRPGRDIVGDLGPQVGEMVGGGVGAALGAGTSRSIPGAMAGAGAGGMIGREMVERGVRRAVPESQDTRSPLAQAGDAGISAGVNALGEGAGIGIAQGASQAMTRALSNEAGRAAGRQGVDLTVGQATGSRGAQNLEAAMSSNPMGAGPMAAAADRQLEQTSALNEKIGRILAGERAPANAGEAEMAVRQRMREQAEQFAARRAELDDEVAALIGPRTPVQLDNARETLRELAQIHADAPQSLNGVIGGARQQLMGLLQDAGWNGGEGTLPFEALRRVRTAVGQDLSRPDLSGHTPGAKQYLERVYAALSRDIEAAAQASGPEAAEALARHDRYVRFARAEARRGGLEMMERLSRTGGAVDRVMKHINRAGKAPAGARDLWALRQSLARAPGAAGREAGEGTTNEAWDQVASAVWEELGMSPRGDDFSPGVFLSNWRKLTPDARHALFAGTPYAAAAPLIEDLVSISGALQSTSRYMNTSNTARALMANSLLNATVLGVGGAIGLGAQDAGAGAAGALLTAGAGRGVSKALASPRFVKWLTTSVSQLNRAPNSLPAVLTRAAAIAEAEPELRDYLYENIIRPMEGIGGS